MLGLARTSQIYICFMHKTNTMIKDNIRAAFESSRLGGLIRFDMQNFGKV